MDVVSYMITNITISIFQYPIPNSPSHDQNITNPTDTIISSKLMKQIRKYLIFAFNCANIS